LWDILQPSNKPIGHFNLRENPRKAYRDNVQAYAGEEKWLWEDF